MVLALMIDVVLQGVWVLHHINKDEGDESLFVVNAISLKYSKEGRSSSSPVGIRNVSSDVCYDDSRCHLKNKIGARCELSMPLRKM